MNNRRFQTLVIIICLTLITLLFLPSKVFAESEGNFKITYENAHEVFEKMSNEELNNFINNIATSYSNSKTSQTSILQTVSVEQYNSIQLAWLAAAQIARNYGYPCAATLVECSVKNIPYSECGEGLFTNKIRTTSVYKDYISKLKSDSKIPNSITFSKSDNADLFYALHKVNIKSSKGLLSIYTITILDTFDFAYDNNYNDLFC
ncbi:hypothetical protein Calow_1806 [Caldicellulosiruptor owensensis OL]|uniref:Uncharacterized protein n=1 Tax=Caldicellulosiruptor owensensis (strain ATCC 700167 / DSM 13100 / OL) TaxID=632518 RepID=E4Q4X5_CALOW|nr:hypothetical protein [Caldicellulosiruptor owensensis]ADQ05335.1 hypothetical protein Calow_1806 [Caldicellulosiruptor owensensis OL]